MPIIAFVGKNHLKKRKQDKVRKNGLKVCKIVNLRTKLYKIRVEGPVEQLSKDLVAKLKPIIYGFDLLDRNLARA
jgi:hypothetical protein